MFDLTQPTPVGRMVQGHPFTKVTTNMKGKPLTTQAGDPREEYFFAVAFPKSDPVINEVWAVLQQIALEGFPGGQSQWPTFSWKVTDGDVPPHNTKEGFPGCWIFKFKNGFQPKVFTRGGAAQIVDASQIKCGDYVRVVFNSVGNGDLSKPGIYLNPSIIELVGYGEEIIGGPSGDVFGTVPVGALPAGASETPVAGTPLAGPPAAGPPATGLPPSPAAPAGPPATGLPAGVAPAPDFLNPGTPQVHGVPGAPGPAVPPAPAVQPMMTAKAAGVTYEAFKAQGWTDPQLIAEGYATNDVPF